MLPSIAHRPLSFRVFRLPANVRVGLRESYAHIFLYFCEKIRRAEYTVKRETMPSVIPLQNRGIFLSTICLLSVYYLSTICLLSVYYLSTICLLFAYLYALFSPKKLCIETYLRLGFVGCRKAHFVQIVSTRIRRRLWSPTSSSSSSPLRRCSIIRQGRR